MAKKPKSKLKDGMIPAHKDCPFKAECAMGLDICLHKGKLHDRAFSCGAARALDLAYRFAQSGRKRG